MKAIHSLLHQIYSRQTEKVFELLATDTYKKFVEESDHPLLKAILDLNKSAIDPILNQERFDINKPIIHYETKGSHEHITPLQILIYIKKEFELTNLVKNPKIDIFKVFMKKGADINYGAETILGTPLFISIAENNTDLFDLIIKQEGVNINLGRNSDGVTPLYLAWYSDCEECLKKLLKNPEIDLNKPNIYGTTIAYPWSFTISMKKIEGLNLNIRSNLFGTPLFYALQLRAYEIMGERLLAAPYATIIKLIQNFKVDVNISRPFDGCTPLYFACWMGDIDIVKLLVNSGANINNEAIRGRKSVFEYANQNLFKKEINDFILSKGVQNWNRSKKIGKGTLPSIAFFRFPNILSEQPYANLKQIAQYAHDLTLEKFEREYPHHLQLEREGVNRINRPVVENAGAGSGNVASTAALENAGAGLRNVTPAAARENAGAGLGNVAPAAARENAGAGIGYIAPTAVRENAGAGIGYIAPTAAVENAGAGSGNVAPTAAVENAAAIGNIAARPAGENAASTSAANRKKKSVYANNRRTRIAAMKGKLKGGRRTIRKTKNINTKQKKSRRQSC